MLLVLLAASAAWAAAPDFPKLSGRVVDAANVLQPATVTELTTKLAALEAATTTQLVVVTVADLQDREIDDYGYQLGRAWGIGQKSTNNGVLLIIAPNERKVRIEVGYGLEPVLTDALTSQIIRSSIVPQFRAGDINAGVIAGADAVIAQLQLPPDQAKALAAQAESSGSQSRGAHFSPVSLFWLLMIVIWLITAIRRSTRGRKVGSGPVVIWGPGTGGWGDGGGWGGGGGGGGFGGFGGGGGGFGGGGSSGSW